MATTISNKDIFLGQVNAVSW